MQPKKLRAVPVLIAVNTGIFLLMDSFPSLRLLFQGLFALTRDGVASGRWWELVSYAFLHGNTFHLLCNMVGLWFAGRIVERILGTPRFLLLYFLAAIVSGLLQMSLTNVPLIGASGSVFAVLLAFTTIFPEIQIMALLFFVVPLRMRAKYLGWGLVLSSLILLILGFEPGIGHAAHLGGCVTGYCFARLAGYGGPSWIERRLLGRYRSAEFRP